MDFALLGAGVMGQALTGSFRNHAVFVDGSIRIFDVDRAKAQCFAGSIGGTSGPSAQREETTNIRTRIFTLPDDALICPGHGPMSTVGIEKTANPFFV